MADDIQGQTKDYQTAKRQYRWLEMIPGLMVWATLALAVIISVTAPLVAILFILIFDVYWLIKSVYVMVYVIVAFKHYRRANRTDWRQRLESLTNWSEIHHLVIIPVYKEPRQVLESTINSLTRVDFPRQNLIVVLATEGRAAEHLRPLAESLRQQYHGQFKDFIVTEHPADLPGEIAAKGANVAWAGRQALARLNELKIEPRQVLVSTFDADTVTHPQYFAYLTVTFLNHPNRWRCSYQPIPLFHNNVWDSLFLMRVVANSTTFWLLSEAPRADRMFTFASHSMPLTALIDVDFWQTDVVNEDSRIFVQCFLHYNSDYYVVPLYLPISMDTVQAPTWWQSVKNQYKQIQRWAYGGVENFPFTVWNFIKNDKFPWRLKFKYTWIQIEGIYSWATAALLIFILGWLPFYMADETARASALVQNGPAMIQALMGLAMIGLAVSAIICTIILPRRPRHAPWYRWIMMFGQWLFLPVTMILFGAIPAIDAQTRMMLGRYMGFVTTEKMRSQG